MKIIKISAITIAATFFALSATAETNKLPVTFVASGELAGEALQDYVDLLKKVDQRDFAESLLPGPTKNDPLELSRNAVPKFIKTPVSD